MSGSKKITLLFFCALLFFILGAGFVFALEVNYPSVPGATSPQDIREGSPDALALYVQYIVYFAVWVVGFVAVAIVTIGGIQYLTSTGKPEAMVAARERISAGFFGLLIILSSWLVLSAISPQFITFNIRSPRAIQRVNIPTPPSPFLETFQSSIDTEIPFGALIEKRIFQKELPEEMQGAGSSPDGATDQQEEKPRMERITEIGRNTASLGMLLTLQSMYLQKLVKGEGPGSGNGCTCSNAEPRCTDACVPEASAYVLPPTTGVLGLGSITKSISDVIGSENVGVALGLASNIGDSVTDLQGFNMVLGGIRGVANNLQNTEDLFQVFKSVSDITGIVKSVGRPEDLSGIFESLSELSSLAGSTDLANLVANIGLPMQGIADNPTNNNSGNISGIFNTTNTILGSNVLGAALNVIKIEPEQLNLISIVQPFSSIVQSSVSLESFAEILEGFSGIFPGAPGLQDTLGSLGEIATPVNNPANVGDIASLAAALANVAPDIQSFQNVLGDVGDIGALVARAPGLLGIAVAGAICPSCTGDVCSDRKVPPGPPGLPRIIITRTEKQNLKLIQNGGHPFIKTMLNAEQQKAIREVRLLKEEIGKLERAEKFMFECPLGSLASLGIFLDTFDSFSQKGWRLEDVKFWDEIKSVIKDNDWATFFCPVSGTIWEKKQPKPQQPGQATPQPEKDLGILLETPTSGLIACTQEAPIGEVIDRAQRLGKKLVERLELLIKLDGEMIEAVDKLHQLISQCSAQSPDCSTVCTCTARDESGNCISCDARCISCEGVCPFDDIEDQIKVIQGVFKKIIPLDGKGEKQGMWDVACTRIPTRQSLSGNPPPESQQESARQGALQDQLPNVENILQQDNPSGDFLGGADICALPLSTPFNQEHIGIIPIIEDNAQRQYVSQVNSLLKDLDDAIRAPMATCTTPPPEKTGITEKKPLSTWLGCGDAVTRVGPDGTLILSCYDEEPAFDDCLAQCYLQGVGEHARYRDSLYRQCLNQCLQTKTQQLGQRDAAIGRHRVNFYCCSL